MHNKTWYKKSFFRLASNVFGDTTLLISKGVLKTRYMQSRKNPVLVIFFWRSKKA